ncbi:hypothetical protein PACTADRAFT_48628 [Pachysolen tannophilus NRRL Y-2460]|uniref:Glycosyltransferase family 71 protein n=1 Tax=Pachysolen tannophilus NRRL Y-2460 TaxID=669874 RepID=A0A1E4TYS0_PACTA|nr:hypothetical protein PACTADRAFT_48628 [Pachysolen tannophilus NRRL Y-2460]
MVKHSSMGHIPFFYYRNKKIKRLLTLVVIGLVLVFSIIGLQKKSNEPSRKSLRYVDTINQKQKDRLANIADGDTIPQKSEDTYKPKLLSEMKLDDYKKELKEFQTKHSYLNYVEATVERYLKENPIATDQFYKSNSDFYSRIFKLILNNKPNLKPLDKSRYSKLKVGDHSMEDYYYKDGSPQLSTAELSFPNGLELESNEVQELKSKHSSFVRELSQLSTSNLNYKGTGIVYVGGAKFTFLVLLSIVSLRDAGSTLPVEVLIPNDLEAEPEFCAIHFPRLNAKCIYLSTILNKNSKIGGYQYKSIALLVSSFENVLLMDSDNYFINNPEHIFNTNPFISSGLVVWPDYWRRVTSPYYYQIANLDIGNERIRYGIDKYTYRKTSNSFFRKFFNKNSSNGKDLSKIPLHDRRNTIPDPSSETGQLLINKKTHLKTIILSLYYNVYGPDFYYPIFSQGTQGQGDKETFIAAANALKENYYQVNKKVEACGYWEKEEFKGTGMYQFDPVIDYKNLQLYLRYNDRPSDNYEDYKPKKFPNFFTQENSKILFLHNNFPKMDPYRLILDEALIETTNVNGNEILTKMLRLFGPVDLKRLDKDFEKILWKYINLYVCDLRVYLRSWDLDIYNDTPGMDRDNVCAYIKRHLKFLEISDRSISLW